MTLMSEHSMCHMMLGGAEILKFVHSVCCCCQLMGPAAAAGLVIIHTLFGHAGWQMCLRGINLHAQLHMLRMCKQ